MIEKIECNPTLEQLYESRFAKEGDQQFKISAKFEESLVSFGIVLTGSDKQPDCKISSFAENIYFRTKNGENRKRYSSIRNLKTAVKNIAKKYGYTFEKLVIEKGEPNRI